MGFLLNGSETLPWWQDRQVPLLGYILEAVAIPAYTTDCRHEALYSGESPVSGGKQAEAGCSRSKPEWPLTYLPAL